MADLIDRAAASAEMVKHAKGTTVIGGQTFRTIKLEDALDAIAALPAQGVRVKPLVWSARDDLKGLHEACGADGLYRNVWDQKNDTWVYEGDPTQARFPTLDAAKAAAQADYERRILAALEPAEAGGVEARGVLSDEQRAALNAEPAGTITTALIPVDALVKALERIAADDEGDADLNEWGPAAVAQTALAAIRGEKK